MNCHCMDDSTYCCICKYSLTRGGQYLGRSLRNIITKENHYYCQDCYEKAITIYAGELRIKEAEEKYKATIK